MKIQNDDMARCPQCLEYYSLGRWNEQTEVIVKKHGYPHKITPIQKLVDKPLKESESYFFICPICFSRTTFRELQLARIEPIDLKFNRALNKSFKKWNDLKEEVTHPYLKSGELLDQIDKRCGFCEEFNKDCRQCPVEDFCEDVTNTVISFYSTVRYDRDDLEMLIDKVLRYLDNLERKGS